MIGLLRYNNDKLKLSAIVSIKRGRNGRTPSDQFSIPVSRDVCAYNWPNDESWLPLPAPVTRARFPLKLMSISGERKNGPSARRLILPKMNRRLRGSVPGILTAQNSKPWERGRPPYPALCPTPDTSPFVPLESGTIPEQRKTFHSIARVCCNKGMCCGNLTVMLTTKHTR